MKEFIVSRDADGWWVVTCAMMPGFVAKANTREEAVEKMAKALSVYYPCGDCKESNQK